MDLATINDNVDRSTIVTAEITSDCATTRRKMDPCTLGKAWSPCSEEVDDGGVDVIGE
jgi:hypothetical protein